MYDETGVFFRLLTQLLARKHMAAYIPAMQGYVWASSYGLRQPGLNVGKKNFTLGAARTRL